MTFRFWYALDFRIEWYSNMKSSPYIVAALLAQASLSVHSETTDPNDCKLIGNDTQRLACFDSIFPPRTSGTTPIVMSGQETIDQAEVSLAPQPEADKPSDAPAVTQPEPAVGVVAVAQSELAAEGTEVSQPEQKTASSEFGSEHLPAIDTDRLEARIVGDFNGWTGNTRFTLDNGQVWQQTRNYVRNYKPRDPIPRPSVTITKSVFNSYKMRIEGVKRTVQVKRVK